MLVGRPVLLGGLRQRERPRDAEGAAGLGRRRDPLADGAERLAIGPPEETIERAALNRWEDDDEGGRDIPTEDLGGTGQLEGDRLTVKLKQGPGTAAFRRQ